MTPPRPEGWLHRAPRPLVMWLAVLMVVCVIAFFIAIGTAIATAFQRAAETGQPVPDMSGGLAAVMTGLAALLPALASFWQIFNQRHIERRDEIARGGAPSPFPQAAPPPEPSPTGGLVNNEALQ
jgi:TRAP-type C4-dicarboxylate transport system permease small subunit